MSAQKTSETIADRTLAEKLERSWCEALCRQDYVQLGALAHEEFLLIGTRAGCPFIMNRQEWLNAVKRAAVEQVAAELRDAIIFDNVIVGTIDAHWRIRSLGRIIEDSVMMTSVWVRDAGGWKVIRRHSTPAGQTNVRAKGG